MEWGLATSPSLTHTIDHDSRVRWIPLAANRPFSTTTTCVWVNIWGIENWIKTHSRILQSALYIQPTISFRRLHTHPGNKRHDLRWFPSFRSKGRPRMLDSRHWRRIRGWEKRREWLGVALLGRWGISVVFGFELGSRYRISPGISLFASTVEMSRTTSSPLFLLDQGSRDCALG